MKNNAKIRQDLAYCNQILARLGMDDLTYTHLSARSVNTDSFFAHRMGLSFSEVTDLNLIEINFNGEVIDGDALQCNDTGYVIHSNIYRHRKDIDAIFHLHTIPGVAVSCMKFGLLPLSQFALHFYNQISYHDYNSLALSNDVHGQKMVKDLANNKVMFLRNHGTIVCGSTIQEAMFYTHHLEQACKVQVQALAAGRENLVIPSHEICAKASKDLLSFEQNLGERDWQAHLRALQ